MFNFTLGFKALLLFHLFNKPLFNRKELLFLFVCRFLIEFNSLELI
jgi:hypothetical protein